MHAAPINKLRQYKKAKAPVVVIDASTGQRWPIWVEIDSTAKNANKADLEIHPAVNFASGPPLHRGAAQAARTRPEKSCRRRPASATTATTCASEQEAINERRPHFEEIFSTLEGAGIARGDLYLAWDFTVASDENNSGRELSMRNDAFAQLGDTNLADGVVEGRLAEPSRSRKSKTNRTRARSRGA